MKFRLFLPVLTFLVAAFICLPAFAAQFNPIGDACQAPGAKDSPACQQNAGQNGKDTNPTLRTIRTAVSIIAIIAAIGAVIMIIISGAQFVTAGGATPGQRSGDPSKIKNAQATIMNALVGLVIIALAWTIVTFVTTKLINP
jgi:Mn2+/Fe2+ NRAMP family transporter